MPISITTLTGELIPNLLLFSILLFAAGLLSAVLFWKRHAMCKKISLWFSLSASFALLIAGGLALFGFQITPVVFATIPQIGNIGLGLDALSGFFAALIGFSGISISVYSFSYIEEYRKKGYSTAKFVFLFNLFLLSMASVVASQNVFAFLVFWEIMALSSYYLVSFEHKDESSRNSGFLYLLMTHFGTACLIVMFLVLAGGAGGTFSFGAFANTSYLPAAKAAIFVLALIGFGVKAGIMPLHRWLPIAHPKAPSNVSALMSGVMLKVAIYGLVRVIFSFLGAGTNPPPMWWGAVLLGIGIVSGLLGVLYSLMEHDLKTLLAYHSIENIGIIMIGIGASVLFLSAGLQVIAALALFAALYHTLNHSLFKSLLFTGAGSVIHSTHTGNIDELGGLVKKMPITAPLFFIGAASIAALPPLNGFVSEWLIFTALLGGIGASTLITFSSAISVIMLAIISALAVAAFVKAFGIPFLGVPRSKAVEKARDPPKSMILGMMILALACLFTGIFPNFVAIASAPILAQLRMPGAASIIGTASTLPTLWVFAALLILGALILASLRLLKKSTKRVSGSVIHVWDCGIPSTNGSMQYSAKGFSMPIIRTFGFAVGPLGKGRAYGHNFFEAVLYRPLEVAFLKVSPWSRKMHTGKLMHYLFYLLIALIAVVGFALIK